MRIRYSHLFVVASSVFISFLVSSCEKDYIAPAPVPSRALTEEFDTLANLYSKGWVFNNNSRPQGAATWQQGVFDIPAFGDFSAFSYKSSGNEYAFAGFDAVNRLGTISSWMITPAIEMKNGDKFSFYTRTYTGSTYADRLQVRLNVTDNSADVGFDSSSVGKFTTLVADINPSLSPAGYPQTWKRFEYTVSGLPNTLLKRRIGFRYYVSNGGLVGTNSNAIGIDKFEFTPQ